MRLAAPEEMEQEGSCWSCAVEMHSVAGSARQVGGALIWLINFAAEGLLGGAGAASGVLMPLWTSISIRVQTACVTMVAKARMRS